MLAAALLAAPGPGEAGREFAEILCDPRAEMLQILQSSFGERQFGHGVQRPATVVEVWASERSGEWMFVTTDIDGLSCIVAHGEGWQSAAPAADPTADPS